MARPKTIINNTSIPNFEIEKLAFCFLPQIIEHYSKEISESEAEIPHESKKDP